MKQDPDLILHMIDDLHGKLESLLRGKSQAAVLLAFIRVIAAMLARADDGTREAIIEAIPVTLWSTLDQFDREHPRANGEATLRKPPAPTS